jgi:hypothetical protein
MLKIVALPIEVEVDCALKRELKVLNRSSIFWTEITTVLQYLMDDVERSQTCVAARVPFIRLNYDPKQFVLFK